MDNNSLKLELITYWVVTNLVAFSLGMLTAVVEFQVLQFISKLEIYHFLGITIGIVFFGFWSHRLFGHLRIKLA